MILACRDINKANKETASWPQHFKRETKPLDLCDRKSIEKFAKEVVQGGQDVDILINNAGTLETTYTEIDGIEKTLLTNHIGPAYLTTLLLPSLLQRRQAVDDVRIVNVSSRLEKNGVLDYTAPFTSLLHNGSSPSTHRDFTAYANSKQFSLLYTFQLAVAHPTLTVNSVTPGMVNTSLSRNYSSLLLYLTYPLRAMFLKSADAGAESVVFAAVEKVGTGRFLGEKGMVVKGNGVGVEVEAYRRTEEVIEYWKRRMVGIR